MAKPESKYRVSLRVVVEEIGKDEEPMYDSGDMKWSGLNYGQAVAMEDEFEKILATTVAWGKAGAEALGQTFPPAAGKK